MTNALLESAEGREWPHKIFHDQSPRKNVAGPGGDRSCDLLITKRTRIRLSNRGRHRQTDIKRDGKREREVVGRGFVITLNLWIVYLLIMLIVTFEQVHAFLFGVYGPFKNISLISSRSFIEGGRKPCTRRKTTWPSVGRTWLSHIWPELGSNHSGEKPNELRVNSLIH